MIVEGLIAVDKIANALRFYDPETLEERRAVASPEKTVHQLAVAPDRKTAYVPLYGDGIYGANRSPNNKIMVVDLARQAIADIFDIGPFQAPHGMAATRDGRLWVACDVSNVLLLINPARRAVEACCENPGRGPHQLALLPDETKLYLSNKASGLSVFDLQRRAFCGMIAIGNPDIAHGNGSGSEDLTVTADGARLLVVDNHRSDLRVIDTATDREIDRVPLAGHPPTHPRRSRLAKPLLSPDGRHLVVTSYATGLAWILDTADYRSQRIVPVAKGPIGIAFAPDSVTAIVASHDSGVLTRIDLAAGRVLDAVEGGDGIEVLAFY